MKTKSKLLVRRGMIAFLAGASILPACKQSKKKAAQPAPSQLLPGTDPYPTVASRADYYTVSAYAVSQPGTVGTQFTFLPGTPVAIAFVISGMSSPSEVYVGMSNLQGGTLTASSAPATTAVSTATTGTSVTYLYSNASPIQNTPFELDLIVRDANACNQAQLGTTAAPVAGTMPQLLTTRFDHHHRISVTVNSTGTSTSTLPPLVPSTTGLPGLASLPFLQGILAMLTANQTGQSSGLDLSLVLNLLRQIGLTNLPGMPVVGSTGAQVDVAALAAGVSTVIQQLQNLQSASAQQP